VANIVLSVIDYDAPERGSATSISCLDLKQADFRGHAIIGAVPSARPGRKRGEMPFPTVHRAMLLRCPCPSDSGVSMPKVLILRQSVLTLMPRSLAACLRLPPRRCLIRAFYHCTAICFLSKCTTL
jgi:hypothetical protein